MAIIYWEEAMNGFFENVVVNQGGNFKMVSDQELVYRWLGKEESAVVVK